MKHQLSLVLICVCLTVCLGACRNDGPAAQEQEVEQEQDSITVSQEEYLIIPGRQVGRLQATRCTVSDALEAYGSDARQDTIYLGEGIYDTGVVLYPDDPVKRVEIYWDTSLDTLRPTFIRINGGFGRQSLWHTPEGITIGTTLEEVETINGKPFKIWGFGWDYGGVVNSWEGGKLPETLGLTFAPTVEDVPEYLLGEVELQSDQPALRAVKPVVVSLVCSFRE